MKKEGSKIYRDYAITIGGAILVALLLRGFVVEAYKIPNLTMKPMLLPGDLIFVEKWKYQTQKTALPARGEVVIYSANNSGTGISLFIKRVVGLPGDEVEVRDGKVILNRFPLAVSENEKSPSSAPKEALPSGPTYGISLTPPLIENFGPEKVPPGFVFAIGDARTQFDAKFKKTWSLVPVQAIKGKASLIWLSIEPNETESFALPRLRTERILRRIQ